jgi:excisionase family DNA binding protein
MLEGPEMPNTLHVDPRIDRRYITIGEAADYLAVTELTIRQMIADGRLRGYRSGTRIIRLRRDEIDAAMRPFGGGAA